MTTCSPRHRPIATSARAAGALVAVALLVTACSSTGDGQTQGTSTTTRSTSGTTARPVIDPGDGGRYHPRIRPADFVEQIDNPYLPMPVGAQWVYDGRSDGEPERNTVTVTSERRQILGISAVVVHDVVMTGGEVTEDTYDWYAQDRRGNVWYLGEDTRELEHGRTTSTEGIVGGRRRRRPAGHRDAGPPHGRPGLPARDASRRGGGHGRGRRHRRRPAASATRRTTGSSSRGSGPRWSPMSSRRRPTPAASGWSSSARCAVATTDRARHPPVGSVTSPSRARARGSAAPSPAGPTLVHWRRHPCITTDSLGDGPPTMLRGVEN